MASNSRDGPKPPAEPAASGGRLRTQSKNKKNPPRGAPHANPRVPGRERPGGDAGGTRRGWRGKNQVSINFRLVRIGVVFICQL